MLRTNPPVLEAWRAGRLVCSGWVFVNQDEDDMLVSMRLNVFQEQDQGNSSQSDGWPVNK